MPGLLCSLSGMHSCRHLQLLHVGSLAASAVLESNVYSQQHSNSTARVWATMPEILEAVSLDTTYTRLASALCHQLSERGMFIKAAAAHCIGVFI